MEIGYVVYAIVGFIIGACICYSLMVVTHDHLKERLKSAEEHLNHNQLLELEQAIYRAETKEQIDNILLFHELAQYSEKKFLGYVSMLRLEQLADKNGGGNNEDTQPEPDDNSGGTGVPATT